MAGSSDQNVISNIRALYRENEWACRLFDRLAARKRDTAETKIASLISQFNASLPDATALAKELQDAGCGSYIVGRRGGESRFRWDYSAISVGRVASGQSDELVGLGADEDAEEEEEVQPAAAELPLTLTIPQAKEALARTLNIRPDQIEITIKS